MKCVVGVRWLLHTVTNDPSVDLTFLTLLISKWNHRRGKPAGNLLFQHSGQMWRCCWKCTKTPLTFEDKSCLMAVVTRRILCVPSVIILECELTNWCLHSQRAPTLQLFSLILAQTMSNDPHVQTDVSGAVTALIDVQNVH